MLELSCYVARGDSTRKRQVHMLNAFTPMTLWMHLRISLTHLFLEKCNSHKVTLNNALSMAGLGMLDKQMNALCFFRHNNPSSSNVWKVTPCDGQKFWRSFCVEVKARLKLCHLLLEWKIGSCNWLLGINDCLKVNYCQSHFLIFAHKRGIHQEVIPVITNLYLHSTCLCLAL